jgi:hypothetical protein
VKPGREPQRAVSDADPDAFLGWDGSVRHGCRAAGQGFDAAQTPGKSGFKMELCLFLKSRLPSDLFPFADHTSCIRIEYAEQGIALDDAGEAGIG